MTAEQQPQPEVNATRFRAAHQETWERLEWIVSRIEKRSVRALDDDDLLALPVLYRTTLSSLSLARETSLDRALVTYLEQLCIRAYFQIYGAPGTVRRSIASFSASGWPRAIASLWRETIVASGLMLLGIFAGYFLVTADATWFYSFVPSELAQGRDPTATAETLRRALYNGDDSDPLGTFATYLFTHNSQVALFCFALGFAFAVPTAMLLIYNGMMLGAFIAIYVQHGLGLALGGWLIIHGSTELFAIILAGAAGFRIGLAVAFPGAENRLDAATTAGRTAGTAMAGVVLMLLIAGLLEGIGRQTIQIDWQRYAVGLTVLAGWLTYYYLPRGANGRA